MGCTSSSSASPAVASPTTHENDSLAVTTVGSEMSIGLEPHDGVTGNGQLSSSHSARDLDHVQIAVDRAGPPAVVSHGSSSSSATPLGAPGTMITRTDSHPKQHRTSFALPTWDESTAERACFGAGCYWGTEKYFRHDFAKKFVDMGAIHDGAVGFMGPIDAPPNPNYRDVCTGTTSHVEVYDFAYSGGDAYFEELVRFFFQFHDPTTFNRQGNDRGTQYASVIYCTNERQAAIAERVKGQLQELVDAGKIKGYKDAVVMTDIRQRTVFYPAHVEHQDYLMKNPSGYCNHRIRFHLWPSLS